jgi:hypothetical protein
MASNESQSSEHADDYMDIFSPLNTESALADNDHDETDEDDAEFVADDDDVDEDEEEDDEDDDFEGIVLNSHCIKELPH